MLIVDAMYHTQLDLSDNMITSQDSVVRVCHLPLLNSLVMSGNPVCYDSQLPYVVFSSVNEPLEFVLDGQKATMQILQIVETVRNSNRPVAQKIEPSSSPERVITGHTGHIYSVCWIESNIVTGSSDGTVRVWQADTGLCVVCCLGHEGTVWSVAGDIDGTVVSGGGDCTVRTWDSKSGQCQSVVRYSDDAVKAVAISSTYFASGSNDGTIVLWNKECNNKLLGHTSAVTAVKFSPSGDLLCSCSRDHTVKVWNFESCLRTFEGHNNCVNDVRWLSEDECMSCGDDDTVKKWSLSVNKCTSTVECHSIYVYGIDVCNKTKVVTASGDGKLRMWDATTGTCVATYVGHTGAVFGVAVSNDNNSMASVSEDRSLIVWNIKDMMAAQPTQEGLPLKKKHKPRTVKKKAVLDGSDFVIAAEKKVSRFDSLRSESSVSDRAHRIKDKENERESTPGARSISATAYSLGKSPSPVQHQMSSDVVTSVPVVSPPETINKQTVPLSIISDTESVEYGSSAGVRSNESVPAGTSAMSPTSIPQPPALPPSSTRDISTVAEQPDAVNRLETPKRPETTKPLDASNTYTNYLKRSQFHGVATVADEIHIVYMVGPDNKLHMFYQSTLDLMKTISVASLSKIRKISRISDVDIYGAKVMCERDATHMQRDYEFWFSTDIERTDFINQVMGLKAAILEQSKARCMNCGHVFPLIGYDESVISELKYPKGWDGHGETHAVVICPACSSNAVVYVHVQDKTRRMDTDSSLISVSSLTNLVTGAPPKIPSSSALVRRESMESFSEYDDPFDMSYAADEHPIHQQTIESEDIESSYNEHMTFPEHHVPSKPIDMLTKSLRDVNVGDETLSTSLTSGSKPKPAVLSSSLTNTPPVKKTVVEPQIKYEFGEIDISVELSVYLSSVVSLEPDEEPLALYRFP